MVTAFLHGMVLAFGLILPLGVQNVFVFNQGAAQRRWVRALPVVLTACLCDTLLILAATLGVSVIVLEIGWLQEVLRWGGLVFLLWMGWVTWKSVPEDGPAEGEGESWPWKRQVLFALSVSLLNPHAILDTIGVIGTSSLGYAGEEKAAFAAACVIVSWLWFFGLMTAGHAVGSLSGARQIRIWLNRVSAVIMWGSGVFLALH
jgi:L-lysine exporter family protein LysE/ArgO